MAHKPQQEWSIYKEEMDFPCFGHALWEPSPTNRCTRINIGDVGFIRRGQFHLLFSASSPLGDRQLGDDVPTAFERLDIGVPEVRPPRQSSCLRTNTVRHIEADPGDSASTTMALDLSTSFTFEPTESHGAALVPKYQTHRMNALVEPVFEKYTKRHYQSWVRFARDKGIGKDVRPVLVSGFDLTKDFAMVTYSDGDTCLGADLTITVPTLASASTSPWGTWRTKCLPHTNQGPLEHSPFPPERAAEFPSQSAEAGNIPREFDECVFLRYYTMRPRGLFATFPNAIQAGAGPHELGPGDNTGEACPEPAAKSEVEPPTSDDENLGGQWDLVEEDDDSELDITGYNTPYDAERDSWDTVADYVFQNSNAITVLLHHRDLEGIRTVGETGNLSALLIKHKPRIVVDESGVGRIDCKEIRRPGANQRTSDELPDSGNCHTAPRYQQEHDSGYHQLAQGTPPIPHSSGNNTHDHPTQPRFSPEHYYLPSVGFNRPVSKHPAHGSPSPPHESTSIAEGEPPTNDKGGNQAIAPQHGYVPFHDKRYLDRHIPENPRPVDKIQGDPSEVAKKAKALKTTLQVLKLEPWDKNFEFQRQSLRKRYIELLTSHPFAKESKNAELDLWAHTSHAIVTNYKQRIDNLKTPPSQGTPKVILRETPEARVLRERILSRFKQFLSTEEKFWICLAAWFRRAFDLPEVQSILDSLEMVPEDDTDATPDGESRACHLSRHTDTVIRCTPEQLQCKLSSVSKILIFLGDIARYQEQYIESVGHMKAGLETGPPARSNDKSKKAQISRARDYEKARQRYEQARVLAPHEGNAFNQLAIISYRTDTFNAIVHYYRAICAQQPYDGAAENMSKTLKKALHYWNTDTSMEKWKTTVPRSRFKMQILALHAYWDRYQGVEEVDPVSLQTSEELCKSSVPLLHNLIADLPLQSEDSCKIVILCLGAHWKHQMLRPPRAKHRPRSDPRVEGQILGHLLAIFRALLEVGLQELAEVPVEDTDHLAGKISITFGRILPALRMINKWLRGNHQFYASEKEKREVRGVAEFWNVYTRSFTALIQEFPIEQLGHLEARFNEDLDVRGFLPLAELIVIENSGESGDRAQVHPDDEQLMRIRDLLNDAKMLAQSEDTPIMYDGRVFSVGGPGNTVPPTRPPVPPRNTVPPLTTGDEWDIVETDNDSITDLMRAMTDNDTDEDVVDLSTSA